MGAMNSSMPSHDTIAERAYHLWESEGRPEGRAEEFWLQAERDYENAAGSGQDGTTANESARETTASAGDGPEISNLDRALSPRDRREARADRRPADAAPAPVAGRDALPRHFLVLLDRAHLRVFGMDDSNAVPALVTGIDAPAGKESYAAGDSDRAGQFPGARKQKSRGATASGGTTDERLPMQQERDRKLAQDWAERLEAFLTKHVNSTWDYAAGPALHNAVLERLSSGARQRLRTAIQKDLTSQPAAALRNHFPGQRPS